jgi:hypothetical protein
VTLYDLLERRIGVAKARMFAHLVLAACAAFGGHEVARGHVAGGLSCCLTAIAVASMHAIGQVFGEGV